MLVSQEYGRMPGIHSVYETQEAVLGWGRRHLEVLRGFGIHSSATDAGNSPNTLLRAGLLMALHNTEDYLMPWDPDSTGRQGQIFGVLGHSQNMLDASGTAKSRIHGDIIIGGPVKSDMLIIPGESSRGIAGNDYEYLVRNQMATRFLLDNFPDYLPGGAASGVRQAGLKITQNASLDESHSGRTIYVEGTGAITLTLPSAKPGLNYRIIEVAGNALTIQTVSSQKIYGIGTWTDDTSMTLSAAQGGGGVDLVADQIGSELAWYAEEIAGSWSYGS